MRAAFIQELVELAKKDKRIMLLSADLGYTVVEPFAKKFPKRFINVGVAEQNMVGIATGLAANGFIPFLYSIVTFASLRAYEFIRNGPILHKLPVRIIGVGEGFDYGVAGMTHYGLEDLGVMRLQERMTVVVPADKAQIKNALQKTYGINGPVYYRIGKGNKDGINNLNGKFKLGGVQEFLKGKNCLFITLGTITKEVETAAQILKEKGINSTIALVSNFNPSPTKELAALLKKFPFAITVEEHYVTGGLGSLVAETIAENKIPCRLVRFGFKDFNNDKVGSKAFMNRQHKLAADNFVQAALAQTRNIKNG